MNLSRVFRLRKTPRRILAATLAAGSIAAIALAAAPAQAGIEVSSARYELWFEEKFDKGDMAHGTFDASPYAKRFAAYDKFTERNVGPARYSKGALSVHDGKLDMFGYKRQLADGSWEPVASAVVPLLGGKYKGFQYGRFEFDLGVYPTGPDGMKDWWIASLLWPDSDVHRDGEIDFPEGEPGQAVHNFVHKIGPTVNPQEFCYHSGGQGNPLMEGTHNYVIDWKPEGFVFYRDGVEFGRTNCTLPTKPLHWTLQLVTLNRMPSGGSYGHVYLDNLRIYKYFRS